MQIEEPNTYSQLEIDADKLTKSQMLRMCVYLMEKKLSFNSNGFTMRHFTAKFPDDKAVVLCDLIDSLLL